MLRSNPAWEVQFADNGHVALEQIQEETPDLIVTDLQMPYVSGLELVQHVKNVSASIPVVLITGHGSEQIAMEALRNGAANYSPKSELSKDLVKTVQRVLDMSDRIQSAQPQKNFPDGDCEGEDCHLAFVLENDMGLIGPLIEHLQNRLPPWSESDRLQIGMALDEALVNAMHHGNLEVESSLRDCGEDDSGEGDGYYQMIRLRKRESPFCDRRVQVRASFTSQDIEVQVTDDGPGFDPCSVADPTSPENLTKVSGRGLFLIRTFMDSVSHNDRGNEITMFKRRKPPQ